MNFLFSMILIVELITALAVVFYILLFKSRISRIALDTGIFMPKIMNFIIVLVLFLGASSFIFSLFSLFGTIGDIV